MPQARTLRRPLDQPGDVGQHRLPVVVLDRPQHRRQRRERVVGHLRRRPSQPPQQRGLPSVGQADQTHVRQQLQPQLDPPRLTPGAPLGKPRSLPSGGRKSLVPMPPAPPMSHHSPLPSPDQVNSAPIHRHHLGAGRHRNQPVLTPSPMPVRPFPMPPPPGPKVLAPPQRPQIPPRRIADEHDIPPMPAIPAVGPALRHMSLPPKAHAPVPPGSALNPDLRPVVHGSKVEAAARDRCPSRGSRLASESSRLANGRRERGTRPPCA